MIEDTAATWNPTITIIGGTFNINPAAYLAEGYTVVENGGVYTVVAE